MTAAEAVALRDAATSGPWVAGRICGTHLVRGSGAGGNVGAYVVAVIDSTGGTGAADAAFIAAAPAIVEALVAVEAERDEARAEAARLRWGGL